MSRKEIVTKVIDGDKFFTNRRKHPVRLANVDAPEKGQKGVLRPGNSSRILSSTGRSASPRRPGINTGDPLPT